MYDHAMIAQAVLGHQALAQSMTTHTAQTVLAHTLLAGQTACKVTYAHAADTVALEVGGTRLTLTADHFILIHEMLRKAAARIVMQATA